MERITIRLVLGCGLIAIGALVLAEQRARADAFVFLSVGTAILAVAGWMWLEYERDRLLRWSKERRVAAVARVLRLKNQIATRELQDLNLADPVKTQIFELKEPTLDGPGPAQSRCVGRGTRADRPPRRS